LKDFTKACLEYCCSWQ